MMTFFKEMDKNQKIVLLLTVLILFIDMVLYSVIIPITPSIEEKFQPSSTMIGFLFSSYSITLLLVTPYFGRLVDRVGRKMPILAGLGGLMFATVLFSFADSLGLLFAARSMQGIAAAATWTGALALLADMFSQKERAIAMGMALTGVSAGTLLGAPIGGVLIEVGGYQTPFLMIAAILIILLAMVAFLLHENKERRQTEHSGMGFLLKIRAVKWVIAIVVVSEASITLLEPLLPIYFATVFNGNSLFVGAMFGVLTVAYGIMAPISGVLVNKFRPTLIVVIGLVLIGLTFPMIVYANTVWQVALVLFLVGSSMGMATSPTLSLLADVVDKEYANCYGAVYGLFSMFLAVAAIIGPFFGGVLTDMLTIKPAFLIIGMVILAMAIGLNFSRKRVFA